MGIDSFKFEICEMHWWQTALIWTEIAFNLFLGLFNVHLARRNNRANDVGRRLRDSINRDKGDYEF
jgi:hypothetical protein